MSKYVLFEHQSINNFYLCEIDESHQDKISISIVKTIWQTNNIGTSIASYTIPLREILIKNTFDEVPKEFLI